MYFEMWNMKFTSTVLIVFTARLLPRTSVRSDLTSTHKTTRHVRAGSAKLCSGIARPSKGSAAAAGSVSLHARSRTSSTTNINVRTGTVSTKAAPPKTRSKEC